MGLSRGPGSFLEAVGALHCRHGSSVCLQYHSGVLPRWWKVETGRPQNKNYGRPTTAHFVVDGLNLRDRLRWRSEISQASDLFRAHPAMRPTLMCLATARPILSYHVLAVSESVLAPHAALLSFITGNTVVSDLPFLAGPVFDDILSRTVHPPVGSAEHERAVW